jgi:two-component system response regulator (stage 0 sporulation protein F)
MEAVLKILAVDNQPSVTLSLRYIFSGPTYAMTTVESGGAALAKLDSNSKPYDVIIIDQKMPDLTGVELVQAIRARGIGSKIVVVSAHLTSDIREAFERLDVQIIFTKPFDIVQLRSAVDRIAA